MKSDGMHVLVEGLPAWGLDRGLPPRRLFAWVNDHTEAFVLQARGYKFPRVVMEEDESGYVRVIPCRDGKLTETETP